MSERLDVVPAQFRVLVVRRPKYACRACEDVVVQAPAPARLIEGGLPTEATVAHVLVSKYADHLPLYRQAQIYARQGVHLDRSTLADWVGRAAFQLRPVHERLLAHLKSSTKLFADETTAPVLDPGRGRTKTGQLWAYARDDRPWGGADPPAVAYVYAPDRKASQPIAHLAGFNGVLQVDGYAGYRALAEQGRRDASPSAGRICAGASTNASSPKLRRSPARRCSASPRSIGSRPTSAAAAPDERRAVRQERSRPLIVDLEPWLREKLALVSQKSKLAEAIRYGLSRWDGLDALPRRRSDRNRLQCRRAFDPPDRPQSQERPLRRLGRRRGKLGCHRFADRNLQAVRRRSASLSRRRAHAHRQRSSRPRNRRSSSRGPTSKPSHSKTRPENNAYDQS